MPRRPKTKPRRRPQYAWVKHRASEEDGRWLQAMLDREGQKLGTRFERESDGGLIARRL